MPPYIKSAPGDDPPDVGTRLAIIEEHLRNQDIQLSKLSLGIECVLASINGTAQTPGSSEKVRQLEDWRVRVEKDGALSLRLHSLEDFNRRVTRILLFVGTPLFGVVLLSVLGLLWGLLTHHFELVIH